jgi:hypothetical protein
MKAGHDCSDRHADYLGDFAVAELVQLAQYDHLAQRRRERLDQLVETPQIGPAFQQRKRRSKNPSLKRPVSPVAPE